jgi:hypothetical protein
MVANLKVSDLYLFELRMKADEQRKFLAVELVVERTGRKAASVFRSAPHPCPSSIE